MESLSNIKFMLALVVIGLVSFLMGVAIERVIETAIHYLLAI